MDFNVNKRNKEIKVLLEILNYSDGTKDLIDIAEENNFSIIKNKKLINKLLKHQLIK